MTALREKYRKEQPVHSIAITGLTRIRTPKPNKGGSTVLAHFDCEANGFMLCGCAFVRTPKNGLVIWPPKIEGPESTRRAVAIIDDSIRHAIMLAARETYRALGGTDAEWVGRCIPEPPREWSAPTSSTAEEPDEEGDTEGLRRVIVPVIRREAVA